MALKNIGNEREKKIVEKNSEGFAGDPAFLNLQASFPPPRNHAAAVAMCREHSNFEVNE